MKKLTVYIADDHHFVRKGMVRVIQGFPRVGTIMEAANGKELLRLMKQQEPDVVIVDLEMPEMDGVSATRHISENYPEVKIIVLTMYDEQSRIIRLMEEGAHGYLLKQSDVSEVEHAIYAVVDKDFYHNDVVARALRQNLQKQEPTTNKRQLLTERELEIVALICKEQTPKEIADALHISEKTVHVHKRNILTKLEVKSSIGILKFAVEEGLVSVVNGKFVIL